MNVNDQILMFVTHYKKQVEGNERELVSVKDTITSNRRNDKNSDHVRREQAHLFAAKNAHMQAVADFDSLFDYMETDEELIEKIQNFHAEYGLKSSDCDKQLASSECKITYERNNGQCVQHLRKEQSRYLAQKRIYMEVGIYFDILLDSLIEDK